MCCLSRLVSEKEIRGRYGLRGEVVWFFWTAPIVNL
jgi:hypothetical protein